MRKNESLRLTDSRRFFKVESFRSGYAGMCFYPVNAPNFDSLESARNFVKDVIAEQKPDDRKTMRIVRTDYSEVEVERWDNELSEENKNERCFS